MQGPRYPALYQLNTRVFLTALSQSLGRAATLDDIADAELDRLSGMGFDWLWLLSVWQTGAAAQRISRSNPAWRREFEHTLPDLREEDIAGSGFAIKDYRVHRDSGRRRGPGAAARADAPARAAPDARLRSEPHGPRIIRGWTSIRTTSCMPAETTWRARRRTIAAWRPRRPAAARPRAGPLLRRLARHAAARLRQPGHCRRR